MPNGISQKELQQLLQQTDAHLHLIDIRSEEEFNKGHVPHSTNIPAELLNENAIAFDKNSTIVCICNRGHERSQNAAKELNEGGFNNVYFLEGGVAGWK